ncbi:MAG: hypothetical protein IT425_03185 [Pirellulales bacterium]|nr:hypothetical protein [Pirellulales bacterium]
MAWLAHCPDCKREMLVPDSAGKNTWARCSDCLAVFELHTATTRELAEVQLVEPEPSRAVSMPRHEAPLQINTVDDLASSATWSGEADEVQELNLSADAEREATNDRAELGYLVEGAQHVDESSGGEELSFADLEAMLGSADPEPGLASPSASSADAISSDHPGTILAERASEGETEPLQTESAEVAAQRIEAWFRSAKTVEEVPPLAGFEGDQADFAENLLGDSPMDSSLASDARPEDEFQPGDVAAWDDAQHMDRLLAEIQERPRDELMLSEGTEASFAEASPVGTGSVELSERAWGEESIVITAGAGLARRKRSALRTFVMVALGGAMGTAAGYFALLWLGGPESDFLQMAQYMPRAILPASFAPDSAASKPALAGPQASTPNSVREQQPEVRGMTEEPSKGNLAVAAPGETAKASSGTEARVVRSVAALEGVEGEEGEAGLAEKQAGFTEPVKPEDRAGQAGTGQVQEPDRYAETTATDSSATATDPPAPVESAELATLPAPPVIENREPTPPGEPVRIEGAPTFPAEELAAALEIAQGAESGLASGNLADSREIARTKGYSYSLLADLAQKTVFVESAAAEKTATDVQRSQEMFRRLLTVEHTRNEVGQIVSRWIASPNRRHGGVFFGGSVARCETKGSVTECHVELVPGQSMTVLVPASVSEVESARVAPVSVVGWIVDEPAKNIPGYTGTATQAIFTQKLAPLD